MVVQYIILMNILRHYLLLLLVSSLQCPKLHRNWNAWLHWSMCANKLLSGIYSLIFQTTVTIMSYVYCVQKSNSNFNAQDLVCDSGNPLGSLNCYLFGCDGGDCQPNKCERSCPVGNFSETRNHSSIFALRSFCHFRLKLFLWHLDVQTTLFIITNLEQLRLRLKSTFLLSSVLNPMIVSFQIKLLTVSAIVLTRFCWEMELATTMQPLDLIVQNIIVIMVIASIWDVLLALLPLFQIVMETAVLPITLEMVSAIMVESNSY